ncbi:hypothetical protein AVEN_229812-1 [Araneus ventricosus]|uniref:Uncharacterized protein n=1 Tax=Araneus ventricosus TaxID=182803 RepID=A0A4Y2T5W8_ARAVE|nr:hypothetical protein AVEN_229812-1 [Araneus ventricosus]
MPIDVSGLVNNSRCDKSSSEAGVLMAISSHGPKPPEGGKYCHWKGYINGGGGVTPFTRTRLLIRQLFNYELMMPFLMGATRI